VEGPITEKARRCLSAERARGTKSSPRTEERRARREARSETGLQRSDQDSIRKLGLGLYLYTSLLFRSYLKIWLIFITGTE